MTAAVALIAGATPDVAARLSLAMLAIQVGIGAANDVADAAQDAAAKPAKPIPAGVVAPRVARATAVAGLAIGLVLAASISPGALALAAAGAATGLAYDFWFKGTVVAWLPFAIGIPLLLLFAWWGARQDLPPALILAAALAVPAGAALAIANALPDAERDARAGMKSVATILGLRRASHVVAVLQTVVGLAALGSYFPLAGTAGSAAQASVGPASAGLAGVGLAVALIIVAIGVVLGGSDSVTRRQRGWEAQAVGLGILAAAWTGGLAAAGRL